jgi:HAE1 family hydrophobic/amphiphilic exporter-1
MGFLFYKFKLVGLCSLWLFVMVLAAGISFGQDPVSSPSPSPTPVVIPDRDLSLPAELPGDPPPVAPNFASPVRPMPSTVRVGVDNANQLSLTVEDAIRLALENNNDIDISRQDKQVEEFRLRGARGVYDPFVAAQGYYESASTPTASLIGGAVNGSVTQTRFFGSGGISGFTPRFGGSYSARLDTSRTTTSNTNSTLNPQYPSILALTYVQPLWRGLRIDNNRRTIEISKRNITISDSQLKQKAIETVSSVERAYWDLVFALRNLQVQIDSVRRAREQLESNQRLVNGGVLAPIEVVAASSQITIFEQAVYAAQTEVTRSENVLKTLLLPDRTAAQWKQPITPVSPIDRQTPSIGLEVSLSEALENRPELRQLDETEAINQIDQKFFRDQTKPEINLVGSYSAQGLAGALTAASIDPSTGLSRVPGNLVGGIGNSLGNLIQQDYPTYRIGITIGLPLGNNVAKANLGIARVTGDRIKNTRDQAEQIIEAEVRNALQALRSQEALLVAARASRISVEQLAESETRQFRAGTTTFFLVQQRQNELTIARSRELQAQTDLNKAISDFYRVIGTTLEVNQIDLR